MGHTKTLKSLRLAGENKKAFYLIQHILIPEIIKKEPQVFIEIAYALFLKNQYSISLYYFKKYLENAPSYTLSELDFCYLSFLNVKLKADSDWCSFVKEQKLELKTVSPSQPVSIVNLEFEFFHEVTYYFTVKCPHCGHEYTICTDATFLIDSEAPCPNCFNLTHFNYDMIHTFLTINGLETFANAYKNVPIT